MSEVPERFARVLEAVEAARLPPRIGYMQLAMAAADPREFKEVLRTIASGEVSEPVQAILAIAGLHPGGWRTVTSILSAVSHDAAMASDPQARVQETARMFDRAVALSPEASVALYSLGDPAALSAATEEVVAWLGSRGAVGPERRLLDLGCGIGRLELALAARVGSITGIDISAAMVKEARRRCGALANAEIRQTSGRDLSVFSDAVFDSIVAVDSFPYIVSAGGELAERMLAEAARVLVTGGDLLILNYSYRGDPELDRADLLRLGRAVDFQLVLSGEQPFRHWDGRVFQLVKAGS